MRPDLLPELLAAPAGNWMRYYDEVRPFAPADAAGTLADSRRSLHVPRDRGPRIKIAEAIENDRLRVSFRDQSTEPLHDVVLSGQTEILVYP